jgi:hypothetical protein
VSNRERNGRVETELMQVEAKCLEDGLFTCSALHSTHGEEDSVMASAPGGE